MGDIRRAPSHQGEFGKNPVVFIADLHRAVAPGISCGDLRSHRFCVCHDGSEVFDHGADMQTFLNIEAGKIFSFEGNGGVHRLLENF